MVNEVKNGSWSGLEVTANSLFGSTSVVCGLGESLAKDIWSLLDRHSVLAASDPVTWALANVLDSIPLVHSEMRMCHDRVKEPVEELSDLVHHPRAFFQAVGRDLSNEFKEDWAAFTLYCERPSLRHGFELGRAVGRVLYQIIMLVLAVAGAAKTAASIAGAISAIGAHRCDRASRW